MAYVSATFQSRANLGGVRLGTYILEAFLLENGEEESCHLVIVVCHGDWRERFGDE